MSPMWAICGEAANHRHHFNLDVMLQGVGACRVAEKNICSQHISSLLLLNPTAPGGWLQAPPRRQHQLQHHRIFPPIWTTDGLRDRARPHIEIP